MFDRGRQAPFLSRSTADHRWFVHRVELWALLVRLFALPLHQALEAYETLLPSNSMNLELVEEILAFEVLAVGVLRLALVPTHLNIL